MSAKERILHRLRVAGTLPSALPHADTEAAERANQAWDDVLPDDPKMLAGIFAQALESVSAEFYSVSNVEEAVDVMQRIMYDAGCEAYSVGSGDLVQQAVRKMPESLTCVTAPEGDSRAQVLSEVRVSVVQASWGVAETGSLVFPYIHEESAQPHFLAENVLVLLEKKRLLPHLRALMRSIAADEKKNMVLMTGPSRTADIEKVLILGAHGPKRVVVMLLG